jgi:hypothetical protein
MQQVVSHSKIEAKQNHIEVWNATMKQKIDLKQKFKVRKVDAISRGVEVKAERDEKQITTLVSVEEKQHQKHLSFHEKEKLRLLNLSSLLNSFCFFFHSCQSLYKAETINFPFFYMIKYK